MTDRTTNPKYLPVKCAVCNGFGTLKYGELVCHGCEGKGYILVPPDKIEREREHEERKQ